MHAHKSDVSVFRIETRMESMLSLRQDDIWKFFRAPSNAKYKHDMVSLRQCAPVKDLLIFYQKQLKHAQ